MDQLRISHDAFGELRLAHFLAMEDLEELRDWEYLGRRWVGEASGFTEWLRLESAPGVTRSVAIDLAALPEPAAQKMINALGLPLRAGLDQQDIIGVFGEPTDTERFVRDRVTLVFHVGAPDPYELSCTVHEEHGLIHLTMHPTPLPDQPATAH
ncbi:hypothetical protein [Micromonospora sp. C28ISP2-4]|uniref:hypothetical protein n=1 Tax=Micromonospora sp. C28ISP2-4 TaxID=3059523 RepID=UPI0026751576|nr:hypothetical protein [Micromonospora sp. C28ISP2-4]MDO3683160.1 hypothetical protein [Micromonospora sp. C28ISP2-4]